jgi:hypothetical protein
MSLVGCAAASLVCALSLFTFPHVRHGNLGLSADHGTLSVAWSNAACPVTLPPGQFLWVSNDPNWNFVGLHFHRGTLTARRMNGGLVAAGSLGTVIDFHLAFGWVFLLTTALGVQLAWLLSRRHPQNGGGLFPACGYDLRASPDRCPECGSPVAKKVGATT